MFSVGAGGLGRNYVQIIYIMYICVCESPRGKRDIPSEFPNIEA